MRLREFEFRKKKEFRDWCGFTFMYRYPKADKRAAQNPIVMAIHGWWTAVIATPMATPPDRAELWTWTCADILISWCPLSEHLLNIPRSQLSQHEMVFTTCFTLTMLQSIVLHYSFLLCEGVARILFLQPLTMFIFPLELVSIETDIAMTTLTASDRYVP